MAEGASMWYRTRRLVLAVTSLALLFAASPSLATSGHQHRHFTVYGTHECDSYSPGHMTADGTDLYRVQRGTMASNAWPMHTLIRFDRPVLGHRYYRVRDTGGGGGALADLFHPCPLPHWNNPRLGFVVVHWGG